MTTTANISDTERINHLEWRLKRLENAIGKSDKLDNKRIIETIRELNEQIVQLAGNNSNAKTLLNKSDDINHLTSADFHRHLMADRSTKLELILADEERIREITKSLSEIDTLARILDGDCFKEIPKLFTSLNDLLTIHSDVKDHDNAFTRELAAFLLNYAEFNLMMDENLQQYKQILNKSQKSLLDIQDNPVE